MSKEIRQPFSNDTPRKTNDIELVEQVLGSAEAAEMGELLGKTDSSTSRSQPQGLELSADETVATSEAEVDLSKERRAEYLDWADEFKIDERWIRENFVFHTDGTVIVEGDFDISNVKGDVTYLPDGLKEVRGNFSVSGWVSLNSCSRLEDFQYIPKDIGGDLNICYFNIPSTRGLDSVHVKGDLLALNFPIYKIPAGMNFEGKIIIDESMVKYKKELEDKGYRVKVV